MGFKMRFPSLFIFFSLLLCAPNFLDLQLVSGQKTVTKAAKKEAIKKRKHEEAMRKAKVETQKIKDRKETNSDKIKKMVDDHMRNAKSAKLSRSEL